MQIERKIINNKKLHTFQVVLTTALLAVSFASYFSFNYFHLFGHIDSFPDAVFTLFQWVKFSGLVMLSAAVFFKTEKFTVPIKYLLVIIPLASLGFTSLYIGMEKTPINLQQEIYAGLNMFMPKGVILALFILESVLMAAAAIMFWVRDGFGINYLRAQLKRKKVIPLQMTNQQNEMSSRELPVPAEYKLKNIIYFLPVFFIVTPLNLFNNFFGENRFFEPGNSVYELFKFGNFTVWHLLAFLSIFTITFIAYRFLKNKPSEVRYKYLKVLSVAVLVQYMSKASMLIGDGYNVYYTLFAFTSLFICNIGVPVAALAIFTKNRILKNISFLIHSAGALSVFFYFGKDNMSNFDTIFNYSFLYFTFTHSMLFALCVLPVLLKEHTFKLKNSIIPIAYYAVVIIAAAATSQIVTNFTSNTYLATYGETAVIYPNYAFSQVSPIPIELPPFNVTILGLTFDMLYLPILFTAYIAIFFMFYGGYYLLIDRRRIKLKQLSLKQSIINFPNKQENVSDDSDNIKTA